MIADMQDTAEDSCGRVKMGAIHGSETYARKHAAKRLNMTKSTMTSTMGKSIFFVTPINDLEIIKSFLAPAHYDINIV